MHCSAVISFSDLPIAAAKLVALGWFFERQNTIPEESMLILKAVQTKDKIWSFCLCWKMFKWWLSLDAACSSGFSVCPWSGHSLSQESLALLSPAPCRPLARGNNSIPLHWKLQNFPKASLGLERVTYSFCFSLTADFSAILFLAGSPFIPSFILILILRIVIFLFVSSSIFTVWVTQAFKDSYFFCSLIHSLPTFPQLWFPWLILLIFPLHFLISWAIKWTSQIYCVIFSYSSCDSPIPLVVFSHAVLIPHLILPFTSFSPFTSFIPCHLSAIFLSLREVLLGFVLFLSIVFSPNSFAVYNLHSALWLGCGWSKFCVLETWSPLWLWGSGGTPKKKGAWLGGS